MTATRTIDVDNFKSRGLGLSRQQKRDYSLTNVVRGLLAQGQSGLSGLERECHQALCVGDNFPQKPDGALIPFDVFDSRRRDLSVSTLGSGGALVQTTVDDEIVPLLRNQSVVQRLGAKILTGLSGNLAIPRQTSASQVQALGEQGAVAGSTPSLDQIVLVPHRISAQVNYSRQLILQSSVDVESFLRDDLAVQLALAWDNGALFGAGGPSPTGILNSTGVGSLIFGGTASWAEILQFENSLAAVNALSSPGARVAFATTPNVRARWKAVAKQGVGVTSVVPIFLWDDFEYGDGSNDGRVNGYRAAASNQIQRDLVFFGNWADLVVGFFGRGLDIIVNPFTLAGQGTIQITMNAFYDVALRHAPSFCVSGDSGAQ